MSETISALDEARKIVEEADHNDTMDALLFGYENGFDDEQD